MRIAVVEDEKTTQTYISNLLKAQGYEVDVFENGKKFLDSAKINRYRVLILDVNLPDMTGFDVCYFIKKRTEVYGNPKILILSGRKEQEDINEGLKTGADDYVKKPFDDTELILRVNKLIEKSSSFNLERVNYKEIIIDFGQSYIVDNGLKIELTNKEKDILHFLVINMGLVLSKEKIYYEVWGEEWTFGNKNLEVYIGKLKKKSETIKNNLVTLKNIGYKLSE